MAPAALPALPARLHFLPSQEPGAEHVGAFCWPRVRPAGEMFPQNACWRRSPCFPREPQSPRASRLPPRADVPRPAWRPPPWGRDRRSAGGGWQPPHPWDAEPFPGPAGFPGEEEDGRRAPPGPWDRGKEQRGAGDGFERGWRPVPPLPVSCRRSVAWPEFPGEEQPPARPPGAGPAKRGGFPGGARPRGCRGPGWKRRCLRRRCRENLASGCRPPRPRVSREKLSSAEASAPSSAQRAEPQPVGSFRSDGARKAEPADPPSQEAPEPPGQASAPRMSRAEPEAAEQGRAAGAEPDGQTSLRPAAAGRDPAALETEPVPTESVRSQREEDSEPAAAGSGCRSALPTPLPSGRDPRSAAVLARKEEIEWSYQRFGLALAVAAAMLLQKEPSMEAAMGLALRANLRQARGHHLRQLESFIDS